MRKVGVHLYQYLVSALEPVGEPGAVGRSEARFRAAGQHRDLPELVSDLLSKCRGPIGAAVVDDDDLDPGCLAADPGEDRFDVLGLVEGWDDDERLVVKGSFGRSRSDRAKIACRVLVAGLGLHAVLSSRG